jgi:ComF family protein
VTVTGLPEIELSVKELPVTARFAKLAEWAGAGLSRVTNSLLPGSCNFCQSPLPLSSSALCDLCIAELPHITTHCRRCSVPLVSAELCGNCQKKPPSFRRCISAFGYQAPVNSIIVRLKTDPYVAEINQLSALLARRIAATYHEAQLPCPLTLIPLPLHWLKMTRRSFNQSDIIARLVANHLHRQHRINVELRSDICKRIARGQTQHKLSAKQRRAAIANAFTAAAPTTLDLQGLSVAVIDDVVTTGATANSVATALLKAGAANVDIWSLARTSWNNSPR